MKAENANKNVFSQFFTPAFYGTPVTELFQQVSSGPWAELRLH